MTTAALILSGGESSRFGGMPKALLRTRENSAVRRLAEISLAQGLDPVVVVVGAHRSPIALELRGLNVEITEATDWYEGRTASVQAGLNALPVDRDVLFWPVDHPFVSPRTVGILTSLLERDPFGVWFIPTYQGHGGHPVAWRSVLRRDLLELRPDAPIRALLPEFGPQVRRMPVDDPGVIANVDTPEAYRAAHEDWLSRGEE
jgi:molybdenum cofactor cytidylyltransferase